MSDLPDPPESDKFLIALGLATLAWARLEYNLDLTMLLSFRFLGGDALVRKLPRAFTPKLEFLRKAFGSLTSLAPYSARALSILDRASALSGERNFLVHAAAEGGLEMPLRMQRFLREEAEFKLQRREVTPEEVLRLATRMLLLFEEASALVGDLLRASRASARSAK